MLPFLSSPKERHTPDLQSVAICVTPGKDPGPDDSALVIPRLVLSVGTHAFYGALEYWSWETGIAELQHSIAP